MNKETSFICAFILSIMIFSTFTPFAYAIAEKNGTAEVASAPVEQNTLNFMLKKDVGAGCEDDVWIDEMDWDEYNSLRSQSVQVIDGWGDKAAGEQEQAYEEANKATNGDAEQAKHVFIPGVDGPALLYDVIRNKAVDSDTTCYLDNLISRGRISYATRLVDDVRYCPTTELGSVPCERKTSTEEAKEILDTVEQATAEQSQDTETPVDEVSDEQVNKLVKSLEKTAPESIVETSDAKMTLNADTNIFFLKTAADFINFLTAQARWDMAIGAFNMIGMGLSLKSIASDAGKALKTKNWFKTFTGRANIEKAAANIKGTSKVAEAVSDAKKAASESDAGKLLDKVEGTSNRGGLATKIDTAHGAAQKELSNYANEYAKNLPGIGDVSKIKIGELTDNQIKKLQTYAKIFKEQKKYIRTSKFIDSLSDSDYQTVVEFLQQNGKLAEGVDDEVKVVEAFKSLQGEVGKTILANQGDLLGTIANSQDAFRLINKLSDASSIADAENALNAAKKIEFEGFDVLRSTQWNALNSARWQKYKGGAEAVGNYLKQMVSKGFIKYPLLLTQYSQSLFTGALFLRNVVLANPQFEAQGVIEFDLNNELSNYVIKEYSQPHYLDIRKTAGMPKVANFLGGVVTRVFSSLDAEVKVKNEMQNKIKNIQDIVFLLDQDALASDLGNTKAINSIMPVDGKWRFFSIYPDETLIYNFEHPTGYTPRGKSALYLSLKNINIYVATAIPTDWFNVPLIDDTTSRLRAFRNTMGLLTLFGIFPAAGAIHSSAAGFLIAIPTYLGFAPILLDQGQDIYYGDMVDASQKVDEKELCTTKFSKGDRDWISFSKKLRTAMAACSMATAPFRASPLVLLGFACDAIQMGSEFWESNRIDDITKDLQNCYEANFEVLSFKDIPDPQELQTQTDDVFGELEKQALDIFNIFSNEVKGQFDALKKDMKVQAMTVESQAKDSTTSVLGKELYYVHYYSNADIRWFQDQGCSIDVCQRGSDGKYKCITQNGYWLMCDSNNDGQMEQCLSGVPSALSLRINIDEGYASVVQRVIEAKKKDNAVLLDIYPDKAVPGDACFKENMVNLSGTKNLAETVRDTKVNELLGELDTIETQDARLWFDGNDVAVQFNNDKTCAGDVEFQAGEIFRFTGGHIKLYRDTRGRIEVIGSDDQVKCDFTLDDGAIGFSNGLIRSGFAQTRDSKTADYSDVYHVFIYNLISVDGSKISKYSMEACELPDGTKGFRPIITTPNLNEQTQFNNAIGGICTADVKGPDDSGAKFDGDEVNVTDQTGLTKNYQILGFDPMCYNSFSTPPYTGPGYKIRDQDGVESCLYLQVGSNGQPVIIADAQAPIPIMWGNGLGGSWMWNSDTGRLSIKNEFPIALAATFKNYGGGGLNFVTPGAPPQGAKDRSGTTTTGGGTDFTNVMAALPWTPTGIELVLFVLALASCLFFIRVRFKKEKDT